MHFLRRVDKLIFKNILTFKNINTKADDGKEGIVIDEERIKKKMEEIKMRK